MKKIIALICLLVIADTAAAFETPELAGRVNDYANVIPTSPKIILEERLAEFERETSNQIVVLTVPSLGGESIENAAVKVFEKWKLGQAKTDNGVLFLVAISDRKMRIEVGYGLEGSLTDAVSKLIIQNEVTPRFKKKEYAEGIDAGVSAIMKATKNEYKGTGVVAEDNASSEKKGKGLIGILCLLIVPIFIAGIFQSSFNRLAGSIVGGIGFAIWAWFFFGPVGIAIWAVVGLIVGAFSGDIVIGVLDSSGGGGGGDYSCSSSGSSSSSDSGSFSGGGGSSGGGGASGDW
jgi:uncharacterized protein